ncbi:MAG TPA: flavin reductase family protein [Candidatus Sulfotelmatobacter sp.]|nr:flavin reductase family protein [Candidatus Sulfotelmatobacter sp.]
MAGLEREFHRLLEKFDQAMLIVTVAAGEERSGCLVAFGSQCSVHPALFLVCLSEENHTYRVAQNAQSLVVHLLSTGSADLARLFGSTTGDEVDKFTRCEWRAGPEGTPVLNACPTWFAGHVISRLTTGDHMTFVLDPFEAHVADEEELFTIGDAERLGLRPGHPA